mmetsp:Transcript_18704/g.38831  ORF Transcript_18704/g.38831 Transcript_18704/m.38831 type:complete len:89 (-) Transcript_18704:42-308(-)
MSGECHLKYLSQYGIFIFVISHIYDYFFVCFPSDFRVSRMPASSTIDAKDRIMGGGISAVARRKGSVSRNSDSWEAGDYGKKESDFKF